MASRRLVGIDLGTTHTVVAWVDPEAHEKPRIFEVPRLTLPGQIGRRPTLGSVLYAPLEGEVDTRASWVVGDFAERRGREVPGRSVFSAKSWLSYAAVDRHAAILPWGAEDNAPRISPVDSSAEILRTVQRAWDEAHPLLPLRDQSIVLTVPASFDPTARQLTLEASKRAGLAVRLLEEPQAAFYDYLDRAGQAPIERLLDDRGKQAQILVCDVGGGTTDLTLLGVRRSPSGALVIERTAVGRHLLLGGDNMDLALAHRLEAGFTEPGTRLPAQRFAELVLAARVAKERLLANDPPADMPVTLAAQGSALVGATRSIRLRASEVEELIVNGFFPEAPLLPLAPRARVGLLGFGLPYEIDPAVTRHVAAFLYRHLGADARIDALLLNGGVFLAPRLIAGLRSAVAPLSDPAMAVLPQPHPDLSVARGAVVYGLALLGRGLRIGGGSAHGYYVAVDSDRGSGRHAMCVVPRGSREAEAHSAASSVLGLTVGTPVRFELYSNDAGPMHSPGELVTIDTDYELVSPMIVHFSGAEAREVRVVLEGELTPIGTLDLACVSTDGPKIERFALAFELRGQEVDVGQRRTSDVPPPTKPTSRIDDAIEALLRVFGKGKLEVSPREVKDLFRQLERLLGPRDQWTLGLTRQLFDFVGPKYKSRRRSLDHERLYWMLTGYLLRPGFGHPLDRTRVQLLTPIFAEGLAFSDEIRNWQQYFIGWRRIAPGLVESEQTNLFATLLPHLSPSLGRGKKKTVFRPLAEPEMLDCATFLERLPNDRRIALGEAILERTWTKRDPLLWAALGRVGARVPVYASLHHVVPVRTVEGWLDHLLREKWEELPTAPLAAVQMARLTNDRARDLDDRMRLDICRRLERLGTDPALWRSLREFVEVEEQERTERFGEQLPVGLRWVGEG
jgi:molecular chaperone DnaK (HSP70)